MTRTIGIDLGTTNSAAAVVVMEEPEVVVSDEGDRTIPSVVGFPDPDDMLVGRPARNQLVMEPDTTIAEVKRHMGDEDWTTTIHGEEYTPEEISSFILQKVVSDAEDYLGERIHEAVITVPAYFGEREREATETAGRFAGLEVKRIINEPTAACLAYGLDMAEESDGDLALVYDLGGGTFDASLVDISQSVIKVIATNGDQNLGGSDFDQAVYEWIREKCIEAGNPDPDDDVQFKSKLKEEAERAKEELSSTRQTKIVEPFLGPKGIEVELTREKFEELTEHLVEATIDEIRELFLDADYEPEDVDEVILVGGSTRIPQVRERVAEYFGQEPSKEVNPDEAVAVGAAIQAAIIDDGATTGDSKALPNEAEDLLLVDVCPKSLGVKLADGSFDPIIEKNENIPARTSKSGYTTVEDNQSKITVKIFEGEDDVAENNSLLGAFSLEGIPPQPAGEPEFKIDFEIDESGILTAEAEDVERGQSADITIESVFGLSDEEVENRREQLPTFKGNE